MFLNKDINIIIGLVRQLEKIKADILKIGDELFIHEGQDYIKVKLDKLLSDFIDNTGILFELLNP